MSNHWILLAKSAQLYNYVANARLGTAAGAANEDLWSIKERTEKLCKEYQLVNCQLVMVTGCSTIVTCFISITPEWTIRP